MPTPPTDYAHTPDVLIVGLARTQDRAAFEELVVRHQGWIRTLMRRCCANVTLADDLAQQVFLQAWRDIPKLKQPAKFNGWLKQLAINIWRQHLRKHDPLKDSEPSDANPTAISDMTGLASDLDRALSALSDPERMCVVLSYHEGMSHAEIAATTKLPVGTVKSHIGRGSKRLQEILSAYANSTLEDSS